MDKEKSEKILYMNFQTVANSITHLIITYKKVDHLYKIKPRCIKLKVENLKSI